MFTALIVWCVFGLAGWWALLRRTPHGLGGRVFPTEWRVGDKIFAVVAAAVFLSSIIGDRGEAKPLTHEGIVGGTVVYCVMLGVLLAFVGLRGFSLAQVFGLIPARLFGVVLAGVGCLVLTYPIVWFLGEVPAWFGHPASEGDQHIQFLLGTFPWADKVMLILLAVVIAPLLEEFLFRGIFYGVLRQSFGPVASMATSALFFAAVHNNIPAIPAYFALALGFTLAYELTGSLWAPIVMHVLFNSISVAVILFFPQWIPAH